jgi:putative DNA methylase
MHPSRKKLIEVALPLEDINREAAREKSIRHGHPSTLHLWWARRPLAAARAVIFAQMVDDPASVPEEFPTEAEQNAERELLFRLLEELVRWENTTNERVLNAARTEIRKSWARWCRTSGEDPNKLPPFYDPFAGGGSLPLEAQRLGLEAHASDLNPVAVRITKAMIEIPPRFAGRPPVNPGARKKIGAQAGWQGAAGLADDVRYYGKWMRDRAYERIGHLYPPVKVVRQKDSTYRHAMPEEIKNQKASVETLTVIAWLWARTVLSPNPAYAGIPVPLVSSFWLSTKKDKEAWVEPVVEGKTYRFEVRTGTPHNKAMVDAGTKLGRGANFRCILSDSPISADYIRHEAQAGRMGVRLMAIVAEGEHGRIYLPPTEEMEEIARQAKPTWKPDQLVTKPSHDVDRLPMYGMPTWGDAFTPRQLVALTTFSDLVAEARKQICADALSAGLADDSTPLRDGGTGATAYAEAVSVYLALGVSRLTDICNALCRWEPSKTQVRNLFGRQAIPMLWDYAENNVFGEAAGDYATSLGSLIKTLENLPGEGAGFVYQIDAQSQSISSGKLVSTDPPYYDNIGYADLSDFFYVWMRPGLQSIYPELFSTLLVPKAEELVASPYRHGSRDKAEAFFLKGMSKAIHQLAVQAHPAFPVTIYYAFRQSEKRDDGRNVSTGWEIFLEAVLRSGFTITGTWPMRTELANKLIGIDANILASSIVLVCRPRPADAPITTRRDFLNTLKREMPTALRTLQSGNIAPVDLAQASIGPGMAIFSRYSKIVEADGTPMRVRTALQLINQTLDEVLAEQEGDFDPDTGWAVAWFDQFGFNEGPYGEAETLTKAKNTAINGLQVAGIVTARAGRVRLVRVDELPEDWDPVTDERLTVWEMVHHLIKALETGESAAAELAAKLGSRAEAARELAYRLYNICERRKRAQEAQAYNGLVLSWPEIARLAQERRVAVPSQSGLFA